MNNIKTLLMMIYLSLIGLGILAHNDYLSVNLGLILGGVGIITYVVILYGTINMRVVLTSMAFIKYAVWLIQQFMQ